jgi:3-oxoacyl-[acyl-carrier-protein] synthase II
LEDKKYMPKKRIVVTGLGAVTSIGLNVNDYWNNLLAGKTNAGLITKFDTSDIATKVACEIKDFNVTNVLDKKTARRMDEFVQYAYTAGIEALTDAGLMKDGEVINDIDKTRVGIIIGSGIGGFQTIRDQIKVADNRGFKKVSPFFIPMMISNMASGQCSILWGFKGPNYCVTSACATGNHALTTALFHLERGDADVMITGGSEAAIIDVGVAGFSNSRAMSRRNDDPKTASRPFDKDRDGFVVGEGSGILVIETEEHALKRGAKIYAEYLGSGMSADAYHITLPCEDGSGAILSMEHAIKDAGIKKEDINYINAHGTSTPAGDKAEISSIKKVFGEHHKNIKVNSTKSMVGHLLGAAGGVEAVALVKSIETGKLHPTINVFNQDPECDMDVIPNKPVDFDVNVGMSNSFGFGGHNCTVVMGKYKK